MTFTPKVWHDGPEGGTPLSAAAIIDLETRMATQFATFVPQLSSPPDHTVIPVYVDTSVSPPVIKQWDGSAFAAMSSQDDANGAALVFSLIGL